MYPVPKRPYDFRGKLARPAPSAAQHYPFLKHPREIRDLIYTYALIPPSGTVTIKLDPIGINRVTSKEEKRTTRIRIALLLANRQISSEALQILYGSATLHLKAVFPTSINTFLTRTLRASTISLIRYLWLEINNTLSKIDNVEYDWRTSENAQHQGLAALLKTLNTTIPHLKHVDILIFGPGSGIPPSNHNLPRSHISRVNTPYNEIARISKLRNIYLVTTRAAERHLSGKNPGYIMHGCDLSANISLALNEQYKLSSALGEGWGWRYEDFELVGRRGERLPIMVFGRNVLLDGDGDERRGGEVKEALAMSGRIRGLAERGRGGGCGVLGKKGVGSDVVEG